jgi:hypothetical protein
VPPGVERRRNRLGHRQLLGAMLVMRQAPADRLAEIYPA